jgi:hypothetical protein
MRVQSLAQVKETPPTRLYLVRHGQVADGHTFRYLEP